MLFRFTVKFSTTHTYWLCYKYERNVPQKLSMDNMWRPENNKAITRYANEILLFLSERSSRVRKIITPVLQMSASSLAQEIFIITSSKISRNSLNKLNWMKNFDKSLPKFEDGIKYMDQRCKNKRWNLWGGTNKRGFD